jgi:predicted nucleic acid-binding protein
MRYLLDTNVLSQQDTHPRARAWIVQHQLQLGLASMTIAEIAQGIESLPTGRRRLRFEKLLEEMLEDFPVVAFGTNEALVWGRYVSKANRPLPMRDSVIAATALANNLQVVTGNEKDFPGVETVNPFKD